MAKPIIEADEPTSEAQITDAEIEELLGSPACFDHATMYQLEEAATSVAHGQARRLTLGILTNPVQQLVEFSKTDPNGYAKAIDSVLSFKKHAEGLLELAVAAELRLLVADERETGLEVVQ